MSSFYRFHPQTEEECRERREALLAIGAREPDLNGLFLLAPEGVNATVAGPARVVDEVAALVRGWLAQLEEKRSRCPQRPFGRWKVLVRKEAVVGPQHPHSPPESYLSPEEWRARLGSALVLDVRNGFEIEVGRFPSAIDPGTRTFRQFANFVQNWDVPRDTPILTYCTGGIRCEKAVPMLREAGFSEVYQLHGGILAYFERFGQDVFEGECFVFDERIAVTGDLAPSQSWTERDATGNPVRR